MWPTTIDMNMVTGETITTTFRKKNRQCLICGSTDHLFRNGPKQPNVTNTESKMETNENASHILYELSGEIEDLTVNNECDSPF